MTPTDNSPPAVTGGYLFSKDKINAHGPGLHHQQRPATDPALSQGRRRLANPARLPDRLYQYVRGGAVRGNWRDPASGYATYIDTDTFVDYHWIVEYSKNIDGTRISNYMYKDRNGKMKMEPIWDWDLSWGNADYAAGWETPTDGTTPARRR